MKFCPKCKTLLIPKKKKNKVVLECPSCGHTEDKGTETVMKEVNKESTKIDVVDPKEIDGKLPTIEAECEKCGNKEAYYWLVQTRAADEAQTKFMRCTKCNHTWRDYS